MSRPKYGVEQDTETGRWFVVYLDTLKRYRMPPVYDSRDQAEAFMDRAVATEAGESSAHLDKLRAISDRLRT